MHIGPFSRTRGHRSMLVLPNHPRYFSQEVEISLPTLFSEMHGTEKKPSGTGTGVVSKIIAGYHAIKWWGRKRQMRRQKSLMASVTCHPLVTSYRDGSETTAPPPDFYPKTAREGETTGASRLPWAGVKGDDHDLQLLQKLGVRNAHLTGKTSTSRLIDHYRRCFIRRPPKFFQAIRTLRSAPSFLQTFHFWTKTRLHTTVTKHFRGLPCVCALTLRSFLQSSLSEIFGYLRESSVECLISSPPLSHPGNCCCCREQDERWYDIYENTHGTHYGR